MTAVIADDSVGSWAVACDGGRPVVKQVVLTLDDEDDDNDDDAGNVETTFAMECWDKTVAGTGGWVRKQTGGVDTSFSLGDSVDCGLWTDIGIGSIILDDQSCVITLPTGWGWGTCNQTTGTLLLETSCAPTCQQVMSE